VSAVEPSVAKVLELYKSAVYAKDADAFIRLYDPSARVFDAWGIWSYEGASDWQEAVEGWFLSLGTERVKVTFDEVSSIATPALTFVSAFVTYAGISAEGEQLRSMQNRITWVLKTSGHVLRIVHEHTSAPAGFEDSKVILQRPSKG
jgi:ketosteroid isomerase-like protein